MAPHGVGLVGDVEGDHHVAAGALAVGAHPRHHRRHPLGDRRVIGVGADFVVLDEVHPGLAERLHQRGDLLRRQADIRLDDRPEERPAVDAQPFPRPGDAEDRARIAVAVGLRHPDVGQAQARHLAQVVEVAGHGGGERRQVGAHVGHRVGNAHPRPAPRTGKALALLPGAREARLRTGVELLYRENVRGGAVAQLVRLAGHAHEGAAALLAGHDAGNLGRIERRLDQILRLDEPGPSSHRPKDPRTPGTAGSDRCRPSRGRRRGSARTSVPSGRRPPTAR